MQIGDFVKVVSTPAFEVVREDWGTLTSFIGIERLEFSCSNLCVVKVHDNKDINPLVIVPFNNLELIPYPRIGDKVSDCNYYELESVVVGFKEDSSLYIAIRHIDQDDLDTYDCVYFRHLKYLRKIN